MLSIQIVKLLLAIYMHLIQRIRACIYFNKEKIVHNIVCTIAVFQIVKYMYTISNILYLSNIRQFYLSCNPNIKTEIQHRHIRRIISLSMIQTLPKTIFCKYMKMYDVIIIFLNIRGVSGFSFVQKVDRDINYPDKKPFQNML